MKSGFILILFCLIISQQASGQMFGIGTSTGLIKVLVERSTKGYNACDTCGRKPKAYRSFDVKYRNDTIVDVTQCYQQEYVPELRSLASYCEHYMMDSGRLSYVLTQFENITVKKIWKCYDDDSTKHKIGQLYFAHDFERYSKVYSSNDSGSSVEWRKTVVSELPVEIQDVVLTELTAARVAMAKRNAEALEKAKRERGDVGVAGPGQGTSNRQGGIFITHSVSGRSIMSRPDPPETIPEFREGGKVILQITVERDGVIVSSRVISAGNSVIRSLALRQIQKIRFNKSATAPMEQFGNLVFRFKAAATK